MGLCLTHVAMHVNFLCSPKSRGCKYNFSRETHKFVWAQYVVIGDAIRTSIHQQQSITKQKQANNNVFELNLINLNYEVSGTMAKII